MTLKAYAACKTARDQTVVVNASDHTGAPAQIATFLHVQSTCNFLP